MIRKEFEKSVKKSIYSKAMKQMVMMAFDQGHISGMERAMELISEVSDKLAQKEIKKP